MTTSFQSNKSHGRKNTAWVAGVAAIGAPSFMYFGAGSRDFITLMAVTVGAVILAYGVYWVRGLVGGAHALSFDEERITIERKKGATSMRWADVKEARFETINTTPWLTFFDTNKKKHRIALEDFEESARKEITNLVMNKIPQKTTSTRDWIMLNRIPVSLVEKGIKVIND